jgi:ADP-ribose 1''-phosphate phosphatase
MTKVTLSYHEGDLLEDAPNTALLVHACNASGAWGNGIAKQFRENYPEAYAAYHQYCRNTKPADIIGKSMLITQADGLAIGCLFVREGWGQPSRKEREAGYGDSVLRATKVALATLLQGLAKNEEEKVTVITEIRMPKINSGLFGIEWQKTEDVITAMRMPDELVHLNPVKVYEL